MGTSRQELGSSHHIHSEERREKKACTLFELRSYSTLKQLGTQAQGMMPPTMDGSSISVEAN